MRRRREATGVSVHTLIGRDEGERLYDVYRAAFGHLEVHAAARQVLKRDEFFAELQDPRVAKYVARSSDGEPLGLMTLSTSLEPIPWISAEYYRARFPEQAERDAIYYVGVALSDPEVGGVTAFPAMVNAVLDRCRAERAVLLWDICGYNDDAVGLGRGLENQIQRRTGLPTEVLDRQTYYGVVFP